MPLKNYTSTVPAKRSIEYIEQQLMRHNATQVVKRCKDGKVVALLFTMIISGKEIPFKIPARVAECQRVLGSNLRPRARPETRKKIPAQAERTAWKIVSDWVEAQMAMIELAQIELMEVFLPYVYDVRDEKTYFEKVKESGGNYERLLTAGDVGKPRARLSG